MFFVKKTVSSDFVRQEMLLKPSVPPSHKLTIYRNPPLSTHFAPKGMSSDQALRELREQYNRLQDDFKGKLTEVAGLRADNEKLKTTSKEAEEAKKAAEEKLKELEKKCKNLDAEKDKVLQLYETYLRKQLVYPA